MKLVRLRLCNFRCFGPDFVGVDLDHMNFLLGPNGAGKTAVLQALSRMFSIDPGQKKIRRADFHVPHDETPENKPDERDLWIEADFEFPELEDEELDEDCPAVPGGLAHMQLLTEDGPAQVRFRLAASMDQDGEIEESFTYVIRVDDDGEPTEQSRASKQDRNAIQVHYLPARRDPADHISYSANALVGRLLRSADWSAERETIESLTGQISGALTGKRLFENADRWLRHPHGEEARSAVSNHEGSRRRERGTATWFETACGLLTMRLLEFSNGL